MGLQDEASEKPIFIGCFPKIGCFGEGFFKSEGLVLLGSFPLVPNSPESGQLSQLGKKLARSYFLFLLKL